MSDMSLIKDQALNRLSDFSFNPIVSDDFPNVIMMTVPDGVVSFSFDDLEQRGSHEVNCVLTTKLEILGSPSWPFTSRLNILSSSGREGYCRQLAKAFIVQRLPWDLLLSRACSSIQQQLTSKLQSTPIEQVLPRQGTYLLEPFLLDKGASVIFGMGSTGKTYLALRLAISLASGGEFLSFVPVKSGVSTLFIDYEACAETIADRWLKLLGSSNLSTAEVTNRLHYFNPAGTPLHDLVPVLKREIQANKTEFIVVDSAALACGGEPEKAESALRYFNALSALKTTSLTIAHVSKAEEKKYPFGSIFWWNSPRCVWNIQSDSEAEDQVLHGGLFQRKNNEGALSQPVGYKIYHGDGYVDVNREAAGHRFTEEFPIKKRIIHQLKQSSLTLSELYAQLNDVNQTSIRTRLYSLEKDGKIYQNNDKWFLTADDK